MTEAIASLDQPPVVMARFPCDRLVGTVLVRDQQALRRVHILALKFLQVNPSLTALLDAFGLGRQVMQEVLADLIFEEAVRIDLEADRAVVAEPYSTYIQSDKLDEIQLKLSKTYEVRATWLLDRTSGEIFADRDITRYTRPPAANTVWRDVKSGMAEVPDIRQTSHALLARAAIPLIEDKLGTTDFDISRVEQIEDKRKLRGETLHVPLKTVQVGAAGEEFFIPDAPGIPPQVRERWTALLNRGRVPLEQTRNTATEDPVDAPTVTADLILQATADIRNGIAGDLGSASNVQNIEAAIQRVKRLTRWADELERSTGHHGLVVGNRETQLEGLQQLIAKAEKSILLVSAFATEAGLRHALDLVSPKLRAGVKVCFAQGLAGALDPTETHEFGDGQGAFHAALRREPIDAQGRLTLARTRRPTHSKFVVIDGRIAAVSSFNWLSGSGPGPIEATAVTAAQLPVAGVLEHAIDVLPNEALILHQVPDFLRKLKNRETREHFFKKHFEVVEGGWTVLFANPGPEAKEALEAALAGLDAATPAVRALRPATTVTDSEHRGAMFRILEKAQRAVLITSDRFSEDAAGELFAGTIGQVLARKVSVKMRWGRFSNMAESETQESSAAVAKFLARLEAVPPNLQLAKTPSANHSKVVVQDDQVALISSFNFLSFGADEARLGSRELGLLIHDSNLARQVQSGLEDLHTLFLDVKATAPRGVAPATSGPLPPALRKERKRFTVPEQSDS